MSPHPWSVLKVKNMDTTRRATEDVQHVQDVNKKTQTTWKKIAPTKPKAQIAKWTTLHFQEREIYIKEKNKSWRQNIGKILDF